MSDEIPATIEQMAQSLEKVRQQLLNSELWAEALCNTASDLTSAKSIEDVIASMVINISNVTPHDAVQIFLVDNDGNAYLKRTIEKQDVTHVDEEEMRLLRLPLSTTSNLIMMDRSEEPCLVDDLDEFPWLRNPTSTWAKSFLGAAIRVRGSSVGFLVVLAASSKIFQQEHVLRLKSFANLMALAIEKANLVEQLNQLSTIDSLTRIPNRRHFFNLAEAELIRSMRYNHPLSALMMDIDYFKQVNDSYGHTIGDQVLLEVARRCEEGLRANDLRGRYGGEEFAFILPETDLDAAVKVADRLRKLVSNKTFATPAGEIRVTVSIGVTDFSPDIPSARALLDQADQALTQAKQTGRNRVAKSR